MTYDGNMLNIDEETLSLYGENIARTLKLHGTASCGALTKKLIKATARLQKHRDDLAGMFRSNEALPPMAEWLLDNCYLARREGIEAAEALRHGGKIPRSEGNPALLALCFALIRSSGGKVTKARCELFLDGCQQVYVLSRRELSLFVPMLKAAAVFELTDLYCSDYNPELAVLTAENLFTTLRTLSTLDLSDSLESVDRIERVFNQDPAGIYPLMSEKTRRFYKLRVEKLAKLFRVSETGVADKVCRLAANSEGEASHIGYWLFRQPLGKRRLHPEGWGYIVSNTLITLFLCLLLGSSLNNIWAILLLLLPVSEIVKTIIDFILLRLVPPTHVPRMELENGVPQEGRTICIVCALLSSEKSAAKLARQLEEFRLANRECGENLIFGILADLPDSNSAYSPQDEKYILSAEKAITELNNKYGGGFFFFIRPRVFSKKDNRFMAWERKRGAIMELSRLLYGQESSVNCRTGSSLSLRGVRYILTLDEDTRLTPGSAKELIGAMLHPLNAPVIDVKRGVVTAGHGIIHPRISTELTSYNKSNFSRIYADQGGTDPYGCDSSELYMDLYDNGSFTGKGIIDVSAFLECMDGRIPQHQVLSHDALEGAYLHGGFMCDVELIDTFPSDVLSYFKRMHRWTRGDWQNLPWLIGRGRELCDLDRFRLYDSLRRSLVPILAFIAMLIAFFIPNKALSFTAFLAFVSISLKLFTTMGEQLFRKEQDVRMRCHSSINRGVGGAIIQTGLKLIFLPYEAYVSLGAVLTSVYRMLFTHTGMLDWTPASVFDGKPNSAIKYWGKMWICPFLGLILLLFAPSIMGKALGIIWILAPLVALSYSKQIPEAPQVSEEDRSYLLRCAREMWTFFNDFCTAEDHFLPPDNFQERPPAGVAHRSSPTNIGLCLISCLAAIDLKLTAPENAIGLIQNILATLQRMPKWNGHLYNWYDLRTLKPLPPAYVSTVDSGNLAACLIILREGLLEQNEDKLAAICDELLDPMSFVPLYDKEHHLFTIGIEAETGKRSKSFYDLMASEAVTTGFIAIARGEIPRRHWRHLSRAQVQSGDFRGMVSWTGSMFEYLMPRLFFKSARGSLMYESIRFCVGVQKKRTAAKKLPWGISESAFYSLDPALNYRYKAHGCGTLALKRDMDSELVVSPYSSFLALCCGTKTVVSNLRELEGLDTTCKYGFWEAVDFTESRTQGKEYETVRCVMAHHIGMSLISTANVLCEDIMCQRLMRDPSMSAHHCMLNEKLPLGGVLLRRKEAKAPEKPPHGFSVYWERRGDFADPISPSCCMLSNGSYSIMLTDSGVSSTRCGNIAPYYTSLETPNCSHGVELWLMRENQLLPLLPSPQFSSDIKSEWEFTFSSAKYATVIDDLRFQMMVSVSKSSNGEKRVISVSPTNGIIQNCTLLMMLDPVLAQYNDYVNHPAFYRLGLHAKQLGGTLIIKRLKRGSIPESYLCIASTEQMEFSARRDLVPDRSGLLSTASENIPSQLGWLRDPMICATLPIRLSQGNDSAVTLAIAIGNSENEAYAAANRILTGDSTDISTYPADCAYGLALTDSQAEGAMELLNTISYPAPKNASSLLPKRELWRYGISGDIPIVSINIEDEDSLKEAESLVKQHAFLSALRVPFDLVLITNEGGDYMRPMSTSLNSIRQKAGRDSDRIRIIDRSVGVEAIEAMSSIPREKRVIQEKEKYIMSTNIFSTTQEYPQYQWNKDNSFTFYVNHSLPPRAWGNMLTNGNFGYFATDCGTGHMWFENAREYRINRWLCDSLETEGTEQIKLSDFSLFATPDDTDCTVTYGFGYARWEKRIGKRRVTTTAFVPFEADARVIIVEWDGEDCLPITWSSDLVLGGDDRNSQSARVIYEDGSFVVSNVQSDFPSAPFTVCCSSEQCSFTTDKSLWLRGETDNDTSIGGFLGLKLEASSPFVLVCGCDKPEKLKELCRFDAAISALKSTEKTWQRTTSKIQIKSNVLALDHILNGWLPYQALACRLMGRCSIYQSGGAFGFRDQLQDAINLILLDPKIAKHQIIESCLHQYQEGDVMHWWHKLENSTKGVRTRCSDDLLWLPWALCEYVDKTGDTELCAMPARWLTSPPLTLDESDRYETAVFTDISSEVIYHAEKALSLVLERGTGAHGLLKIGCGDWNDGMSKVGACGLGESVWLTWFFSHTAHRFSELLKKSGLPQQAERFESAAVSLGQAANSAWDGNWFLRGYYDDGSPLGSMASTCCKIDSVAQSFAAICPEADKKRVSDALNSAVSMLYDKNHLLVRLFDPPFENSPQDPGYIESYGPGFRENGGQYTHGAIWLVMALFLENRPDEAMELLTALLPETHDGKIYEAEPFVIAADVCTCPDCIGKAGWSWYTGSAGWLFRVITENLLGLHLSDGNVHVSPTLPKGFECELRLRTDDGEEKIIKFPKS